MMKMIDHVCAATVEYIDHMPKSKRKKYGQFFTSKEIFQGMEKISLCLRTQHQETQDIF